MASKAVSNREGIVKSARRSRLVGIEHLEEIDYNREVRKNHPEGQ
jgi:hypothetical protein